jgi:hypothetical protein
MNKLFLMVTGLLAWQAGFARHEYYNHQADSIIHSEHRKQMNPH